MKVVDSRVMTAIDRRAQEEFGFPGIVLLENAGLKSYLLLKERLWEDRLPSGLVVFAVGKGNNGGDGLVIARQCFLEGKRDLAIVCAASPDHVQARMCERLGIPMYRWDQAAARTAIGSAATLFDGITGTGIEGALKEPYSGLVEAINQSPAVKVAIDVPSGVGDSYRPDFPAVRADYTLTMGLPKLCLYLPHARPLCGEIWVVPLGFPPRLVEAPELPGEMLDWSTARIDLPALPPEAYKNRRGSLGVFAGAPGTTGAAVLAASAAARSRAGLVSLFAEPAIYSVVASRLTSVMAKPWDPSGSPLGAIDPGSYGALLVGPGWGQSEDRLPWLEALLACGLPGVLDADGLNLLAAHPELAQGGLGGRWILTPHPGEFARLSGVERRALMEDPLPHVLSLSQRLDAIVVLKSHVSYLAQPDGRYWILDGMNSALGTGGSGDLLAGIIAGFLATGATASAAARAGVYVHHRVGRRAYEELGWFAAEELLPFIAREARLDEPAAAAGSAPR